MSHYNRIDLCLSGYFNDLPHFGLHLNYFIVFIVSFLSATILPLGSEGLLVYYAQQSASSLVGLWLWASVGNTLGALTNWYLGRYLVRFENKKWFPVSQKSRQKAEKFFNRYGYWSLLFTWLPLIGDAIALVAGVLHTQKRYFLPFVFVGKAARYAVVLWGQNWLLNN